MKSVNNQSQTNLVVMASPTMNFANMVPEDEQAVDTVGEAEKLSLFGVSKISPMEDIIPDDEKSVPCSDKTSALLEAEKLGLLSPVVNMARISSSLTDKLFAAIRTDEKGERHFEYCQQYEDGTFSPMMQVAQSDLYLTASYGFLSQNISERKIRSQVENFLTKTYKDYMGKATGEELLDVSQILQLLFMARMQLPVDNSAVNELSPDDFYNQVMYEATFLTNSQLPRKSYYAFSDQDIAYLADKLGMKKIDFLRKLKKLNLLYLTESSKGYQTCVRFNWKAEYTESGKDESYTEWRYCIFRFDNLKEVSNNK